MYGERRSLIIYVLLDHVSVLLASETNACDVREECEIPWIVVLYKSSLLEYLDMLTRDADICTVV